MLDATGRGSKAKLLLLLRKFRVGAKALRKARGAQPLELVSGIKINHQTDVVMEAIPELDSTTGACKLWHVTHAMDGIKHAARLFEADGRKGLQALLEPMKKTMLHELHKRGAVKFVKKADGTEEAILVDPPKGAAHPDTWNKNKAKETTEEEKPKREETRRHFASEEAEIKKKPTKSPPAMMKDAKRAFDSASTWEEAAEGAKKILAKRHHTKPTASSHKTGSAQAQLDVMGLETDSKYR